MKSKWKHGGNRRSRASRRSTYRCNGNVRRRGAGMVAHHGSRSRASQFHLPSLRVRRARGRPCCSITLMLSCQNRGRSGNASGFYRHLGRRHHYQRWQRGRRRSRRKWVTERGTRTRRFGPSNTCLNLRCSSDSTAFYHSASDACDSYYKQYVGCHGTARARYFIRYLIYLIHAPRRHRILKGVEGRSMEGHRLRFYQL